MDADDFLTAFQISGEKKIKYKNLQKKKLPKVYSIFILSGNFKNMME
jgi:hypothetical protein